MLRTTHDALITQIPWKQTPAKLKLKLLNQAKIIKNR